MPSLDDYLKGKPLNEELEQMMLGRETNRQLTPPRQEHAPVLEDPDRPLTIGERENLRRTIHSSGWPAFKRLMTRALRERERRAIISSQDDPLGNRDKIATDWAYMAMWKEQMRTIDAMVENELVLLAQEKAPKPSGDGNE